MNNIWKEIILKAAICTQGHMLPGGVFEDSSNNASKLTFKWLLKYVCMKHMLRHWQLFTLSFYQLLLFTTLLHIKYNKP